MRGPRHFFTHSSAEMLDAFFDKAGAAQGPHEAFLTNRAKVAWATGVMLSATPTARHLFYATMADVGALAGDLGAQCLRETLVAYRAEYLEPMAALKSDYDRGIWIWVHDSDLFQLVLARWFFERRRPSGTWTDAYEIPVGASLGAADIKPSLMGIVDQYDAGAPGVVIESYQLDRVGERDGAATLLSITYEGRWNTKARIANGEVSPIAERVVHQVAVQIESDAGLMYVVSESRSAKLRRAIADTIARVGLGLSEELASLPRQCYSLQRLLSLLPFAWDPAHGIESVSVSSLTLSAPSLGETRQRTFSSGKDAEDVRAQAIGALSVADRKLAKVVEGQLRVVFGPRPERKRGRVVTIGFNGPQSITLNLDSPEQDLLRARYFDRWGLIAPRRAIGQRAR